jgi:hypothetical protein
VSIPKIASFYWGNERMSYLRYLTLASFRKQNPDWRMQLFVHRSDIGRTWGQGAALEKEWYRGPDYLDRVLDLGVELIGAEGRGILERTGPLNDVHLSNLIGFDVLAKEGGCVFDMDILFIRPIDKVIADLGDAEAGRIEFQIAAANGETRLGYTPVCFLASSGDVQFWRDVLDYSIRHQSPDDYESACTPALTDVPKWEEYVGHPLIKLIPQESVFPFSVYPDLDFMAMTWTVHVSDGRHMISPDSIGVHWNGGSDNGTKHCAQVTEESLLRHTDTLCLLAREMGFGK